MAYEVGTKTISVPASADLSAKQFLFGTIDADGQVAVTGAGAAADGVIGDKPGAAGRPCALYAHARTGREGDVRRGAFANGALLEADAAGKAVTQAAGKILAKALAAGAGDGDDHPGPADPSAVVRQAAARKLRPSGAGLFCAQTTRGDERYVHADSR